MRFTELTDELQDARPVNTADADITGIAYDSRDVQPGFVFIAMKGGSFDGHDFIPAAVQSGAAAVVAERDVGNTVPPNIPCVLVPDGRMAMGHVAAPFYGHPSRRMKLVGVTGTSGKTTVTHLIQSIFNASGCRAGLIGTLGYRIGERLLETKHTTPESVDLQHIMAEMVGQGVRAAAMEVSSHGLFQGRTLGCEFDCGVFTNIARDHLDFHKTFDAYLDAKLILFRDYPGRSSKRFHAVINADDPSADKVRQVSRGDVLTFGIENAADLTAANIEVTDKSVSFDMRCGAKTVPVRLGIGGFFNVYNALAASAAAVAEGFDPDVIVKGLAAAPSVPGRFESVRCGQDFGVIVDYAHTPDELENVLRTARDLTPERLIVVFGCGGDRDRGKRPIMGQIGADLADLVVVTSDNPRTEDPRSIVEEILTGIPPADRPRVTVQVDRKDAIREAISLARAGDVVVIAGKGHEDYQIFADRAIHFDDREIAREVLSEIDGCSRSA